MAEEREEEAHPIEFSSEEVGEMRTFFIHLRNTVEQVLDELEDNDIEFPEDLQDDLVSLEQCLEEVP